jgi:uncharacterized protein YaaR (DUF327 family)
MQQVLAQTPESRPRVGDLLGRSPSTAQKQPPAEAGQAGFSSLVTQILTRKGTSDKTKNVEDLMADLDNDERDFADNPSRDRFETYRKTVKMLVNLLVARGYRLQGWEDKKKRRYEVVKTIDARLAQLYSSLLRRNQDVVIALHLMGQIRGLIFDLQA